MSPQPLSGRPSTARADTRVIALLCLVLFTSGADMLIITPILPRLAADLGVGVEKGGLWVTAYAAATASFALVFGPICDRVGRRPIVLAGLAVLALGTGACGLAWSFWSMLGARFVAGIGGGLLMTSVTAFVGDHFPDHRRAIAMGWVMTGFFLSLILSVPLGSAVAAAVGWARMFGLYAAFAGALLLALLIGLPHPREEHRADELSVGSALKNYVALLANRQAVGVLLMSASIGMSMTMFMVYASPWLERVYGFDTATRGLVYTVGGPAVIIGGPIAGRLANRFGRVRVVMAGSALMGGMQLLMPMSAEAGAYIAPHLDMDRFAALGSTAWPLTVPTMLVFFLCMIAGSSRSSPFQTLALEVVAPNRRGALSAIRNTFNQFGSGTGAALGGLVWAKTGGDYATVCMLACAITVAGITALRLLTGSDPSRSAHGADAASAAPDPRA